MASSVKEKNESEDFEAFLEPDFQPLSFANDLLLATNNPDGSELDVITPLKKLKFDANECDKRMTSIASSNSESLVSNFPQIEKTRALVNNQINPSVERVSNSFERIRAGVIKPYDDALRMNNALKRIHITSNLLRGASYFMFLVQQLDEIEKANSKTENSSYSNNDSIRLAKLHIQITQLYKNEKDSNSGIKNSNVNLLSIKLIRDYEAIQITKKSSLTTEWIQSITNDFSHHNSFTINNVDLQHRLIALYILNEREYLQTIDKTINKQVQVCLNQLSRSLQSPRIINTVINEIKSTSDEFFDKLENILLSCDISSNNATTNLLDETITKNNISSLTQLYWPKLSYKFKKNIVSTMARGGPITKNLKIYYDGIKNSIKDNFQESKECDLFIDAVDVINGPS